MLRFDDLSEDEYFVSARAAGDGIEVVNESGAEDLVILRHFGPGNAESPTR